MEIEQKQPQLIEKFVKQASILTLSSLPNLIVEATSHPSLFAFSEILAVPNLLQLEGTENSTYFELLRLFAHGTWTDYKNMVMQPVYHSWYRFKWLKLKQLSVLTLAESNKVLSYDQLLQELEVANVRELEDFLINECMYVGIVKGKLDHSRRSFEVESFTLVQFVAGRDLRHGQLDSMMQKLTNCYFKLVEIQCMCYLLLLLCTTGEKVTGWIYQKVQEAVYHMQYHFQTVKHRLDNSDNLLSTIEEKIKWAEMMSEADKNHKKEVKSRLQEAKKSLHHKASKQFRVHQESLYSEFDGEMDYEEDLSRSKRYFSSHIVHRAGYFS
ncbi:hypothetical protein Patl1_18421 [Pistacia atlantica]|uniref:Uncharacterized protein n=1 Tax=Pistacia atlantica TaxID=434234 RepID=A0ACC1BZZ5_9ROSI|nr:hypothetical protein Patl1_18421 [Pistacia atlantica]